MSAAKRDLYTSNQDLSYRTGATAYPYRSRYGLAGAYQPSSYLGSSYVAPKPPTESWVERIPVQRNYIDYVPEQRVEYVPVEKTATDYMEVRHERDYVPVPRYESKIDYVPVERVE